LSKNAKVSNFVKILPVTAELFHAKKADKQAEMTKLIDAYRSFAESATNVMIPKGDKYSLNKVLPNFVANAVLLCSF
jgi:hypothetical protein